MVRSGWIGGQLGYQLLCWISRRVDWSEHCNGSAYAGRSKLEVLFGSDVWSMLSGRTVLDFGCGDGEQAIEIAKHGACKVIGVDIQEPYLQAARRAAQQSGVAERCEFVSQTHERVDIVLSLDGFEHYADPGAVLKTMRSLVCDDGRVLVCFGPTWFHPYGGHAFSVFPWAHLIFTERALIRWRADKEPDGATCFRDVRGGLNQMSISRFEQLLTDSDFHVEHFEAVPIRPLRWLWSPWTREFTTAVVRCILRPAL